MHGQSFPRGLLLREFASNMFHVQRRDGKEQAVQQFGRREAGLQIHAYAFAKNGGSVPADAECLEQRSAAGPDLRERNAWMFGRHGARGRTACVDPCGRLAHAEPASSRT